MAIRKLQKQHWYYMVYSRILITLEEMRYIGMLLYCSSFGSSDLREQLVPLLFDKNEDPAEFKVPEYKLPAITDDIALVYSAVVGGFNALVNSLPRKFRSIDPREIVPIRPPMANFSLKGIEYQPCKAIQEVLDWFEACISSQPSYPYAISAPLAGIDALPVPTTLYFSVKIAQSINMGLVAAFNRSNREYVMNPRQQLCCAG